MRQHGVVPTPAASVIVPAHNEANVIGRLLRGLNVSDTACPFEIVVVCNGCSDASAVEAREACPSATVVEIADASKHHALVVGDRMATTFPRLYVDADVEIDAESCHALVKELELDGIEAVAPARRLDLAGASWAVRAYYAVWQELPAVQQGLYGRGVIAVTAQGWHRLADRPDVMGDDLYVHRRFSPGERRIVPAAVVVVRAPRTTGDLVRRRIRAAVGNSQAAHVDADATPSTRQSIASLATGLTSPEALAQRLVFLSITVYARVRARQLSRGGRPVAWLRDTSSRE